MVSIYHSSPSFSENCRSSFSIVKGILDGLFDEITSEDWVGEIRDELRHLSQEFLEISRGNSINYQRIKTRFAFIYRYVGAHSCIMYDRIGYSPTLKQIFSKRSVQVSCLGGGSGSELIGILKFIDTLERRPQLTCHAYDKEKLWENSWMHLLNTLTLCPGMADDYQFRQLDVTQPFAYQRYPDLADSDLFTMNFLLSELQSTKKKETEIFFADLVRLAKPGACFFCVDIPFGYSVRWFKEMVSQHPQLEPIPEGEGHDRVRGQLPLGEYPSDLGIYYTKLSLDETKGDQMKPKEFWKVDYRLYQKK
jgi:hypothetical protein